MTAPGGGSSCDFLLAARPDRDSCPQGHRALRYSWMKGIATAPSPTASRRVCRAGAHSRREDAGHARLDGWWDGRRGQSAFRVHVAPVTMKPLASALNRVRSISCAAARPMMDEERRGGTRLHLSPFPVGDREPLKLAVALAFDGLPVRKRTSTFARCESRAPGSRTCAYLQRIPRTKRIRSRGTRERTTALPGRVPAPVTKLLPSTRRTSARDDIDTPAPVKRSSSGMPAAVGRLR